MLAGLKSTEINSTWISQSRGCHSTILLQRIRFPAVSGSLLLIEDHPPTRHSWDLFHRLLFPKTRISSLDPHPVWLHSDPDIGQRQEVINDALHSKTIYYIRHNAVLVFDIFLNACRMSDHAVFVMLYWYTFPPFLYLYRIWTFLCCTVGVKMFCLISTVLFFSWKREEPWCPAACLPDSWEGWNSWNVCSTDFILVSAFLCYHDDSRVRIHTLTHTHAHTCAHTHIPPLTCVSCHTQLRKLLLWVSSLYWLW